MTEEKEWVRLGGKDGVYLVEGEDYTVDREKGILKINEKAWAKVPARCIKYPDVPVDVGYVEEGQEEMGNGSFLVENLRKSGRRSSGRRRENDRSKEAICFRKSGDTGAVVCVERMWPQRSPPFDRWWNIHDLEGDVRKEMART